MNVEEIMKHEIKALSKTVMEYTTDNYISSYAEQLVFIDYPKDVDSLKYLVNQLIEWYDIEILEIEKCDYVRSKEIHKKSFYLLRRIKELL